MLKDMWSVLISPVGFYESLRENPRWLGAVLILLIVTAAGFAMMLSETVDFGRETALKEAPNAESREALGKFFDHPLFKVLVVVGPGVTHIVSTILYAAIALLLLVVTGGGLQPKPFGRIVSVGLWAKLVEIPHLLLMVPLTKVKGSPEIYFGPAALMESDLTDKFFRFASGLDIFHIWYIALFVIGLRICLNISTTRALIAVGLPWFVRQLLRLVWG